MKPWRHSVPITHENVDGKGTLRIKGVLEAEVEPFRAADGTVTTLRDSLFSTVPGTPAYVAKASSGWRDCSTSQIPRFAFTPSDLDLRLLLPSEFQPDVQDSYLGRNIVSAMSSSRP